MAAPSHFNFYTTLFSQVSNAMTSYVNDTASAVVAQFSNTAYTLLLIYMCFWGWSMMRGVIQEPVMDAMNRFMRLILIMTFAMNATYYGSYIVEFLFNLPDALASMVSGTPANTNVSFLDTTFSQMWDLGEAYLDKADADSTAFIPDLSFWTMGWLIKIAGALMTLVAAFLYILSKIMLSTLLGVGGIFILATLFEPTKRFFDVWLGQALTFTFVSMLVAAVLKIIVTILSDWLTTNAGAISGDPSLADAIPPIIWSAIAFLALLQSPSVASALGGGVAMSTLGGIGWAYNKITGGLGSARNIATGKTLSDYRAQRRQKMNNARWAKNNPSFPAKALIAAKRKFQSNTNSVKQA